MWKPKRRWPRWATVIIMTVVLLIAVIPGVALANSSPPSDGIIGTLLEGLVGGVRWIFEQFGLVPIGELVFGIKADGTRADLLLGTFRQNEWDAVLALWVGFEALVFGVLIVIGAGAAGLKLARSGADDRKRAEALQTLQNLGISALLIAMSGPIIYLLFEANDLFIQVMGAWSPGHNFSDMWNGTGVASAIGRALVNVFGLITEVALNFTYMMRKFALLVLVAISPLAFYLFTFESTRSVTKLWFQEIISNIMIQTVHSILIALFFWAYGSTDATNSTWSAFCFLLVLQPTTNLIRSVLSGGRQSNFTGMGLAAAAVGFTSMVGAANAVGTAGTALSTIMRGGGAVGSLGSRVMGQVASGNISPEAMGALGGMSTAMGMANVMPPAGVAAGIAAAGATPVPNKGAVAAAYGQSPDAALSRIQQVTERARDVGGKVGAGLGALAGAGLAIATGDGAFIHAGAAVGGKVGRNVGGVAGGTTTLGAGVALKGGKDIFDGAKAGGVSAGGVGAVQGGAKAASETLKSLMGGNDPNLNDVERREAVKFNLATTIGHMAAGGAGTRVASAVANWTSSRNRARAGVPQMGRALETHSFSDGDVVEFRGLPNRTEVSLNGQHIDIAPISNPEATWEKPVVEQFRFGPLESGGVGWQKVEPGMAPPGAQNVPPPPPAPPRPSWERTGKARGRVR